MNTFVSNRIGIIHDGSSPSQWKHVDGKLNPADDTSRGLSADNFLNNARWLKGPDFLWQQGDKWPKRPDSLNNILSNNPEVKRETVMCAAVNEDADSIDLVIEWFLLWNRLKKFVAWILRYKGNLLTVCRSRKRKETENRSQQLVINSITVDEMRCNEVTFLRN